MKVLIYSHTFAPHIGGVETIVMVLARGLATCGGTAPMEVTLVTSTRKDKFDDSTLPFPVVRRPRFKQLRELIRRSDVVSMAGPALLPMLLSALSHKPFVVEHHGFQTICPNGQLLENPRGNPCPGHFMAHRHLLCLRCNAAEGSWKSLRMWFLTFIRRWMARRAAANLMPTDWLGTQLKLPHPITIHHGLTAPSSAEVKLGPGEMPVFFFLGRLVSTKGVHILLEAAQRLCAQGVSFQFRIAGDGPERGQLTAQVISTGLEALVKFLGPLSEEAIAREMQRATAVLMPSLGGEVFGLVALESMASGCPPVVSDLGALHEVVGDAGLTFPPGDGSGLAICLRRLIEEPGLVVELSRRSRDRAREVFSKERMIESHMRTLHSLVK